MPWGKVDDQLHAHVKWRRATKGARALWTTALSWCASHPSDGFVPQDMVRYLDGTTQEAACLVRVGLWDPADGGYTFHEWSERNPDALSIGAARDAKSEGGRRGNHTRWHVSKGLTVASCEFCDSDKRSVSDSVTGESVGNPPVPSRPDPNPSPPTEVKAARAKATIPTRLPASWTPTVDHKQRATDEGVDLDRELVKFRAHAEEHDRTTKNWNAAFTRWLINAADYARRDGRTPQAQQPARGAGVWDRTVHTRPEETP